MSAVDAGATDPVSRLRLAFDQGFAQARSSQTAAVENLLAIGMGPDPYALRMTDISGLFADKKITRLPTSTPSLLGIAGFRGTMLPVYDLGMLLGYAKAAAPRWLVVTTVTPVALAFERFDSYARARPDSIVPSTRAEEREHVRDVLQADVTRPLIHLPSVLELISKLSGRDSEIRQP